MKKSTYILFAAILIFIIYIFTCEGSSQLNDDEQVWGSKTGSYVFKK